MLVTSCTNPKGLARLNSTLCHIFLGVFNENENDLLSIHLQISTLSQRVVNTEMLFFYIKVSQFIKHLLLTEKAQKKCK